MFVFSPGASPGVLNDRLLHSSQLQQTTGLAHSDALVSFSFPEDDADYRSCCQQALESCAVEGYISAPLSPSSYAALIAVEGMTCNSCVKLIESTVSQRDGVAAVRVSLNHREAFVQFDPGLQSANDLVTAIYEMGFDAELKSSFSPALDRPSSEKTSSQVILPVPLIPAGPAETGGEEEEEVVIGVEGMVCHSCVQNIEMNIGKMRGVREVKVSLEGKNARVNYDPSLVNPREISDAIEDLGFESSLPKAVQRDERKKVCTIGIEGMTCHSCVSLIESSVGEMKGVELVSVSLEKKQGRIEFDGAVVTPEDIRTTIDEMGFITTYISGEYK